MMQYLKTIKFEGANSPQNSSLKTDIRTAACQATGTRIVKQPGSSKLFLRKTCLRNVL